VADLTTDPGPGESAGAMMRAARERQGLHIAALAAAIKVVPRKLDALENDRWHELPDATFVRALAQTVCRTLKIDAKPVLDRLPAAGAVALEPGNGGLNEPFRDRPGRDDSTFAVAAIRPMIWAAAALMVAAVAVYFVPSGLWADRSAPAPSAASAPAAAVAASAASAAASSDVPASAAAPAGTPASAVLPDAAPSALAPAGETVFSAPPLPAPSASAATAAAGGASGIVQLRSNEASWVEVRDGRGQLLLSRIVQPGESVGLDGSLPIRLTIGNAAGTQVTFRGQPVELATRTRDNVARLELQ
jgi:cytoskeleton protein RodZ